MRKPANRLAIAIWIVAALVAILNVTEILGSLRSLATEDGDRFAVVEGILSALTGALIPVAQLAAFAGLIEILDQIRWDARNRK